MSTSSFHLPLLPGHKSSAAPAHPNGLRKAQSYASLLPSFSTLTRRPAAALEYLLEEFAPLPSAESVARHELDSQKAICKLRLRQATTLGEWQENATRLDALEGNDAWKITPESPDYDYALVDARLRELDDARISCDPHRMLFLIRTSLTRYLGNTGSNRLYKNSHTGTKRLIEQYIASALDTITALLDSTRRVGSASIDPRHLLDQIVLARQSFGRSALLLSGGGTFGMNHIGVVKCLWESKLLPRIISGASAGSIVCSVLCTRTDEELPSVLEQFCYGDLDVFTKGPGDDSYLNQLSRLLKHGAIFDIGNLIRVMKNLLGNMTFQEGYNRTRRILSICVSSAGVYDLPRLLNYVTAPNVIIWSAVAASCSVPLVFQPAPLLAKDPRTGEAVPWNVSPQSWIDGSVDNDLPMTRLAELFNVNHFIVSQVNPHVVPFLVREDDGVSSSDTSHRAAIRGTQPGWLYSLSAMAKDEAMHRMHVLSELGVFPTFLTKVRSIMSQRYSGDITILPEISYAEVARVLQNPTEEFMLHATLAGERATWPKLSRIQNHCAIELALDDAVQQLRARIAFSSSQVNLRTLTMEATPIRSNSDGPKQNRKDRKRLRASKQNEFDKTQQGAHSEVKPNMSRHMVDDRSPVTHRTRHSLDERVPIQFQLTPHAHDPRESGYASSQDGDEDFDDATTLMGSYSPFHDNFTSPPRANGLRKTPSFRLSTLSATPSSSSGRLFPYASQPATPMHGGAHAHSYFSSTHDLAGLMLNTGMAKSPSPTSRAHISPLSSPKTTRSAARSPSAAFASLQPGLKRSASSRTNRANRMTT